MAFNVWSWKCLDPAKTNEDAGEAVDSKFKEEPNDRNKPTAL